MSTKKNTPGRPPVGPSELKKKINLMLSPVVIAYLDATSLATGISKSALAEHCIRLQMQKGGAQSSFN